MIRLPFLQRSAVLGAGLLMACGAASEPTGPAGDAGYSVSVSGDVSRSMTGLGIAQYIPAGYTTITSGGSASISVTLISLASLDLTQPQVNLGILGPLHTGSYRVRSGSWALGSRAEFYGYYQVPNPDGTRRAFDASDGTVTITAIRPMIQGTFAFHSATSVLWPAEVVVGTMVSSTPASLSVGGTFAVRAP